MKTTYEKKKIYTYNLCILYCNSIFFFTETNRNTRYNEYSIVKAILLLFSFSIFPFHLREACHRKIPGWQCCVSSHQDETSTSRGPCYNSLCRRGMWYVRENKLYWITFSSRDNHGKLKVIWKRKPTKHG